jgi:hypothetical protein
MTRFRGFVVFAALACALAALPAAAVLHTWSGAVNGNWSNAGNWSAGGAPANGETGVQFLFPNAQGNMASMVNDVTGLSVTSIAFADTAYVLSGNAITLNGSVAINNGTTNLRATVGVDIALAGDAVFSAFGTAIGPTRYYGLDITGVVSGPFGVTTQSTGDDLVGEVYLGGANTYTGVTVVGAGYCLLGNASALGGNASGTGVAAGGTLRVQNLLIAGEALSANGSGASGNGTLQLYGSIWTGPITMTSDTIFQFLGNAQITGIISGPVGINFRGFTGGVLTLVQPNTYSGLNTIEYGTVIVNGAQPSSPFRLDGFGSGGSDSTLGGIGTVGAVTTGTGPNPKRVDPGGAVGVSGTLSTGNFSLNDTANGNHAVLHVDLGALLQFDQVNVAGTADVTGAALEVSFAYTPVVGHAFTVLANDGADPVVGTFAGLPTSGSTFVAGGFTLSINYAGGDGNDVVLTVTSLTPVQLERFAAD